MLELCDVTVRYGPVLAVDGVTLSVGDGKVVALLGANGAGKSSTMRAVSGLIGVAGGQVRWNDRRIDGLPAHKIVRLGICQVPEGREVFAGLSVRDNLRLGAYRRRDRAGIAEDMERVFEYFPVLRERESQAVGTLSGGEQQQAVMGRAIMSRPSLLLLDEPSLGLAPLIVAQVFSVLTRIAEDLQLSILLVEQDATTALSVASSAYVLEAGRVVAAGSGDELRQDEALRRSYLGY
ncbi:MAG: livF 1 [Mycobacterium sp.]|jgi:branched-chain amino acid transport system ATP-binding protein|nr:livF 1 [Mycobacterium sp.]